jgi:Mce-associated membrane protein
MMLALAVAVALAVLLGWLGFRAHQSEQAHTQGSQFLQAARQCALNLTTIDWQKAESDVKRILDGATGQFHDDFAKRAQPFIQVVKQAKSTTVGTVTDAGLESQTVDSAQVLVAVTVTTSNTVAAQPDPHS